MSPVRRPPRSEGDKTRAARKRCSADCVMRCCRTTPERTFLVDQRDETCSDAHASLEDAREVAVKQQL